MAATSQETPIQSLDKQSSEKSTTLKDISKPKGLRSRFSFLNFPAGTYLIFGNEFCERFSYHGMRVLLSQYLLLVHMLPESQVKLIYHMFLATAYFAPLFGSLLADGYFGRFRVIVCFSLIYCLGHGFMSLGAIPAVAEANFRFLDFIGLFLFAFCTGCIKPCILPFAADQFPPEKTRERTKYFSFFFVVVGVGALLSTAISPLLRYRVQCFGQANCFPLAFGIPAILMLTAVIIFIAGIPFYKVSRRPTENVVSRILGCICSAIKNRVSKSSDDRTSKGDKHWLYHADKQYNPELIEDIRVIFNIAIIYIPAIIYWALQGQQGSSWIVQGNSMSRRVGTLNLQPEQLSFLTPSCLFLFIVLFETFLYPACKRLRIMNTRLQKMGVGCVGLVIAYAIFGVLQVLIDKSALQLPGPENRRAILANIGNRSVNFAMGDRNVSTTVPAFSQISVDIHISQNYAVEYAASQLTELSSANVSWMEGILIVADSTSKDDPFQTTFPLKRVADGNCTYAFIFTDAVKQSMLMASIILESQVYDEFYSAPAQLGSRISIRPKIISDGILSASIMFANSSQPKVKLGDVRCENGGATALVLARNVSSLGMTVVQLVPPYTVPLFLQVIPYVIAAASEVLFEITGTEFAYSQAALTMKSVMSSVWYMTITMGNLLNMLVFGWQIFEQKSTEFFFFTGLMAAFTGIFVWQARRYRYTYVNRDGQSPD